MKTEHRRFTGWADFTSTVTRPASPDVVAHSTMETMDREEWTWTRCYGDALKLASTGWAEGFKQVTVKTDAIAKAHGSIDMTARYAEAGDEVDVGLFLSDEPECMVEFPLEPRRKPVVKLVVSASFSSNVDAECIYNRGAAIVAAVDLLEGAGIRVEVELDQSIDAGAKTFRRSIPLKGADEPMDRDKMAFAICHPSTLRRLIFRLHELEGHARWVEMDCHGYGMPLDPEANAEAITVPYMKSGAGFHSMEQATQFAERLIAEAVELVK